MQNTPFSFLPADSRRVTWPFLCLLAVCALLLLGGCSREHTTELMNASKAGNVEAVQAALQRGSSINEQSNKGKTALMFAAAEGKTEVARLLIQQGADVDMPDQYGTTAIIVAATAGEEKVVSLLLQKGANPRVRDESGSAPLVNAVYLGHTATVKLLLAALAPLEKQDGEELLLLAAGLGHSEIVHAMIEAGVDANGRGLKRRTALMAAAAFDRPEVVSVLLENGANPEAQDEDGNTATDVAREKGNEDILARLSAISR